MLKKDVTHVERGDLFRCGPHLFQCGDLLIPGQWERLVDVWLKSVRHPGMWVYSDPPWNAGNLAYWRTMAGEPTGKQDYTAFVERFVACVAMLSPRAVYVENPVHSPDPFILAASANPVWPDLMGKWTVRYGNKRPDGTRYPNLLLRFAREQWDGDPTEMHGQAMTEHVFDNEPVARKKLPVLDPCVGLGMTVRVAHARGIPCVGNELNPKRLARTIGWLQKQGVEVQRL